MSERHVRIWELLNEATDVFGWPILLAVAMAFCMGFSQLYCILCHLLGDHPRRSWLIVLRSLSVVSTLARFFALLEIAHRLLRTAEELKSELAKLQLFHRDSSGLRDLLMTVKDLPVRISVAGFFYLHRSLVILFANSILTYLVILLQFADPKDQMRSESTPAPGEQTPGR
ncbi:unnamed protein product [Darwinula stevensoni]|uniref:Uncharacterized protein n=1 Tax=Darwinula stevensoni TaxID=69355 RepID=A0A7R9ACC3_9CRUS|nr:unnamed protein product [Darwinula stevensoni]CAG0899713.1 unnamed protein product [Darwinula stevensoni]